MRARHRLSKLLLHCGIAWEHTAAATVAVYREALRP